jgi:hypothetical protein
MPATVRAVSGDGCAAADVERSGADRQRDQAYGPHTPLRHADFAVYSDCASGPEIVHSSGLTGENGEFRTSVPIGRHLLSVTSPLGGPIDRLKWLCHVLVERQRT